MMKTRKRKLLLGAAILGAGTLFQAYPVGCNNYLAALTTSALNWCNVLNCSGTSYFNFCQPNRILIDCPTTTTTQ